MLIENDEQLEGMRKASKAVAITLAEMKEHIKVGMNAHELDRFGAKILEKFGAKSAPKLTYDFPGYTCICLNKEIAHGIPYKDKVFKEGDLINIDVSAELNGYWSDNGGSFVLGEDLHSHQPLVDKSKAILKLALQKIKPGFKIADLGGLIESEAKKSKYKVIKNLAGHGVGRSLHEEPDSIMNYRNRFNFRRFKKDCVVAIETFITTKSTLAVTLEDGWTLVGNKGGFCAQHEHTIIIRPGETEILTAANGVFNF